MKVKFEALAKLDNRVIESNSIIQKEINQELFTLLSVKGNWIPVINSSLKVELIKK